MNKHNQAVLEAKEETKKYVKVTGIIASCCVGHSALIECDDGEEILTTEVIKIDMIWHGGVYFETKNSVYEVSGAIMTLPKEKTDIQNVFNKMYSVLRKSEVKLNLGTGTFTLGDKQKHLQDCIDWFQQVSGAI